MNIFVTKLGPNVSNADLLDMFSKFGEVASAKLIMDRETGNSKGYGFVEMENDAEGNAAIEALDDTEVDGRRIVVKKARPREEGGSGGGGFQRRPGGGGGGGGRFNNDRGNSGGGYSGGGGGGGYDRGNRGGGSDRYSDDD
jgi:RNA recognition motif-containing protein